jgi:hypothetical protein
LRRGSASRKGAAILLKVARSFEFLQTRYLVAHGLEMLERNLLDREGAHSRSVTGVLWPATAMVPSNGARYCEGEFQLAHQTSERDKVQRVGA